MPRDPEFRLLDIIDHADNAIEQCHDVAVEEFLADRRLRESVLHSLMVVGEAAGHLPEEITAAMSSIPWPRVRAFPNVIIHEYFGVRLGEAWGAVTDDLPVLRAEVWRVLQERFPEAARRYEEERP